MNSVIRIGDIAIHMDEDNRYCLNDLHKASGNNPNDLPSIWLRTKTAKKYVNFLADLKENSALGSPIITVKGTANPGIYATKELVFAYAMWLAIAFHHEVIYSYDRTVTAEHEKLEKAQEKLSRAIVKDPNCVSSVFKQKDNKITHAVFGALESLGLVRVATTFKPMYRKEITLDGWAYCSGYSKKGVIRIKPEMHNALISLVKKSLDGNNLEVFE